MENLRIGFLGNIGVGKSTLVQAAKTPPLCDLLLDAIPRRNLGDQVYVFDEHFNPVILKEYYKDPVANAYLAQMEFLNGRLERQKTIAGCRGIVLEDRTLMDDYHVFGKAQRVLGNMTSEQFLAYERTYRLMIEKVEEPDLVVYLRAEVNTLIKRIQERGREEEKSITPHYLATLNGLYEEFITHHVHCPVLIIDANEEADLNGYLERTIHQIADKIKTVDLRVATPGLSDWVTLPEAEAVLKAVDIERKLEDYLHQHHHLITIAGNLGLGKSTLASLISGSLKIPGLYEDPLRNPLLFSFLADKPRYCFELQQHFLKMRSEQRRKGKSGDSSYVKDRSLPEDYLIFCQQFRHDGYLNATELDLLGVEYRQVNSELPLADLMICLKGPAELAWRRIRQRDRKAEVDGGWKESEVQSLAVRYRNYPDQVRETGFHTGPILDIDVGKIDLTNRIHLGYVFEQIYDKLKN